MSRQRSGSRRQYQRRPAVLISDSFAVAALRLAPGAPSALGATRAREILVGVSAAQAVPTALWRSHEDVRCQASA
jgi:hypothetical protein